MSEHTPGRIQLAKEFDGHIMTMDGLAVSDCCLDYSSLDHDQQVSNARRLVACWNACEGIDTHKLEGKTIAEYVASEAYVTGLATGADGVNLGLSGLACQMLASSFAGQFKGTGAINYLELRMHHAEIGHFVVNIQRQSGETPCQQLAAARAQRDELLAALEKIAGFTLSQFMGPHDMALECVTVARAAIAKVEGGAV